MSCRTTSRPVSTRRATGGTATAATACSSTATRTRAPAPPVPATPRTDSTTSCSMTLSRASIRRATGEELRHLPGAVLRPAGRPRHVSRRWGTRPVRLQLRPRPRCRRRRPAGRFHRRRLVLGERDRQPARSTGRRSVRAGEPHRLPDHRGHPTGTDGQFARLDDPDRRRRAPQRVPERRLGQGRPAGTPRSRTRCPDLAPERRRRGREQPRPDTRTSPATRSPGRA